MGVATQVTDFSDLMDDLQGRARVTAGVTAVENVAKRLINNALQRIHIGNGEKFPWAERRATLITQPQYTTGTITATIGSTTVTGASTAWNTNNSYGVANMRAGGKIVIAGGMDVYEISAVASDTSATLKSKFVPATVTAGTYLYFEDEYALSADFLRPIDIQFFDQRREIPIIGRREFRRMHPRSNVTGKPLVATIFDQPFASDTTPVRSVVFWKPPDVAYLIPYHFVTNKLAVTAAGVESTSLVSDTDEPIVPLQYRQLIVLEALYNWYRDKQDDTRSKEVKADYDIMLNDIEGDVEIGASRPQFRPMMSPYKRAARRPYNSSVGRFTVGDRFDEIR